VSATATPTSGSSSSPWTETFQYDGFANLTSKTLNGTTTPIPVNAATNQLTNAYYDAAGNMTSGAGSTLTYDVSNRIATATAVSGGQETYEYAPDNKRIHRVVAGTGVDEWTFYGAKGEKLGIFSFMPGLDSNGNPYAYFAPVRTSVYFAGKLVYENGAVNLDRLGTNHASKAQFLPYGEELTSTSNDRTKFATYTRDSYTGLDYADQRFYASTYGRFMTPDPYRGSAHADSPLSWNRYTYVTGDPINRRDPHGLCDASDWYTDCYDDDINNDSTDYWAWVCQDNPNDPYCSPSGPTYAISPAPPPQPAPPPTCQFTSYTVGPLFSGTVTTPGGGTQAGFYIPINLGFTASGGNGSYSWTEQQTVTINAATNLQYSSGVNATGPSVIPDQPLPVSYSGPNNTFANYSDNPGVAKSGPLGTLTGGTFNATFSTQVTVTSGGQSDTCSVQWTENESFRLVMTPLRFPFLQATGSITVSTPVAGQ